jgi:hypothetical protein
MPMQRAMAVTMALSSPAARIPNLATQRLKATDFTRNASAPESLINPLCGVTGSRTNQGSPLYAGFQSVTGTTIRRGRRPISGTLTTTAGRTFWISAPMDGRIGRSRLHPASGASYKSSSPNASNPDRSGSCRYSLSARAAATSSSRRRVAGGMDIKAWASPGIWMSSSSAS